MSGYGRCTLALSVVVGLIGLAAASAAGAATQVGTIFPSPDIASGTGYTELQSKSAGNSYAAPSAGVITSWSFQAEAQPPSGFKLKLARSAAGDFFTIVGESPPKNPVANTVNTYTDVRIPVKPGDVIGSYAANTGYLFRSGVGSSFAYHALAGDQAPETTADYGPAAPGYQIDLSAVLEPDCDGDGFGDETQDSDLSSCNPDTTGPETTITKQPKDKTKKKQATFEFSSTEAGSTFECSLDGGAFAPCTSPDTVKVKKGKHSFEVRAIDAAANVDGSPATDDWKVKKKKKKAREP